MELKTDDATLVRLSRGGDRKAFEELIDRHYAVARSEGLRLLRDPEMAEDLAQEVFIVASLHLAKLREDGKFGGWVRTIARNLARTWRRSASRSSRLGHRIALEDSKVQELPDQSPNAADSLMARQERERLLQALATLSNEDRDLVTRHFLNSESQREIAASEGVHHTTIHRRLEAILGRLQSLLTPRSTGAQRAKYLCTAVAALPLTQRAMLARETAALTLQYALPSALVSLNPYLLKIASGALIMTTFQKIAVTIAIIAVAGFGGYYATRAENTEPSRTVQLANGSEKKIEIATGETVRLTFDKVDYPQNEMAKYVTDYREVDMTALPDGTLRVRLVKPSGEESITTVNPDSLKESMVGYHIWQEMNLFLISTMFAKKTAGGIEVVCLRTNKPELLPAAKGLEAQMEAGRITREGYQREMQSLLANNGMLPSDPANRAHLMSLLASE